MRKILVVDDEESILEAITLALEMEGFEVLALNCGKNIVEKVKNFLPDLIILDILIPCEDGREICKEIKSNSDTKRIPVVMISAHQLAGESVYEYGGDAFLPKPFEVEELLTTIREHLK